MLEMMALLAVMLVAMFWFSNRQRKKQMAALEFRNHLMPGQEIMTIDRMLGTIVEVDDETNTVVVESMPGMQMRFSREAIASLIQPDEPEEEGESWDEEEMVVPDDASSLVQEDSEDTERAEWQAEQDEVDHDSSQDKDKKDK